jgi:hypothetical protein
MDQNVYDATGGDNWEFSSVGGIDNCYFNGSGAPNGAIGIQFGDTGALHYKNDTLNYYNQPNDVAMMGINKIYFTEHTRIDGLVLEQDTGGLEFQKACLAGAAGSQCQNSFDYNWVDKMRCGTFYGPANNGANAFCLASMGGALVIGGTYNLRANLYGKTGFHQEVVLVDATSTFGFNTIDFHYEDNGPNVNQNFWLNAVTGATYQANSGTLLAGTGQYSQPTGVGIMNWSLFGQPINLVPDPGFRLGNVFWGLNVGWSILYASQNDQPGYHQLTSAGLNELAVLGTGAPTTAAQIGTPQFNLPKNASVCMSLNFDTRFITAGAAVVAVYSGATPPINYAYETLPNGVISSAWNNCTTTDNSGTGVVYLNPSGATIANGQYLAFSAPMITEGATVQNYSDGLYGANAELAVTPLTVGTLPTIANFYGQSRTVNDWNGTLGPCVGGSTHWGEAIWSGSGWQCH